MQCVKTILPAIIFSACFAPLQAQHTDTIINVGIYKSYYSFSLKEPLYVTYALYKGGGNCSRKKMRFKADSITGNLARDYSHSGYEEGHLANAEDFAYSCTKEAQTFYFYNCVPQTLKLNRGIWKTWETKIRMLSQKQKLFIVAGCIYKKKTIGPDKIAVPDYCYKIVLNAVTKKIIYCMLFPNNQTGIMQNITLAALKRKLHYSLIP